jgi:hypothetical protein
MAIWLVTCSCRRTTRLSSHWAAKPAAKLDGRECPFGGRLTGHIRDPTLTVVECPRPPSLNGSKVLKTA